jgi:hypothetical protein
MTDDYKTLMQNLTPGSSPLSSTEIPTELLKRKKERDTLIPQVKKNNQRSNKKTSKRDEERILKYALKLSEKEFLEKNNDDEEETKEKISVNYQEIEECKIVYPTEEEFKNPIAFFDSLWNYKSSTGIIKIIPPKNWKERNRILFWEEYCKKFETSDKKLDTRKIVLNEMHKAKVKLNYL